jgi:hypothetical protein
MQRQIHRHARHNGAQQRLAAATAPKEIAHAIQAGVLRGVDERSLGYCHLERGNGGQGRNRCVLQPTLGPGGVNPSLFQAERKISG